jgi:hypothetical protein
LLSPPTVTPSPKGESAAAIAKRRVVRVVLRIFPFPNRVIANDSLYIRTKTVVYKAPRRPPNHATRQQSAVTFRAAFPRSVDLLRVLSLMGIRGGFAVRRSGGSLIRREARGVGSGKGVALRFRYAVLRAAAALRLSKKRLEILGDSRL